jgi:glycosyltransferase involved in cell wall biosynthesis
MPWLPIAVRDMLKQDLGGERLELLCCDDGSSDGSLAFLQAGSPARGKKTRLAPSTLQAQHIEPCSRKIHRLDYGFEHGKADEIPPSRPLQELSSAMGPCAAFEAKRRRTEDPSAARPSAAAATTTEAVSEGGATTTNPAFVAALRAPEDADHPSFAGQEAPEEARMLMENPLTPEEVLEHVRPEHTLLVLSSHPEGLNLGQGAAMTACLRRARGPFIAQMESDDVRERCDAFKVDKPQIPSPES